MARTIAILRALGVAFRRDQKSFQSVAGNNFFIVTALLLRQAGIFILLIIGLVRLVDSIVGLFMDEPRIWVTYLIVGVLFSIAGALVFRRRRSDII